MVGEEAFKNRRSSYQDSLLRRLAVALPEDVKVLILADRGFGDQKLYRSLTKLKFDYLIRFRGNINVAAADRIIRPHANWAGIDGGSRTLRNVPP